MNRRRLQKGETPPRPPQITHLPRYPSTSESFSVSYLGTTHQPRTSTTQAGNTMASNNALQVNEGLLGDPPYLTRQDVRDDEDFEKLTSRLPGALMEEAPHPNQLFKQWETLDGQVRGLAFHIMEQGEPRPWDALSAKTAEKLLEIAPTTAKRFGADDYSGFILIAAWLWRIITDGCLCNPSRYDTPVWEAFGTLDAVLSRRAGTIDGAIHRPPLPGKGTKTDSGPAMDALTTALGGSGNMEPYKLEYRYHQWRALTYGMLRHDEAVPHASPDRLARAIVEAVTAAFDLDDEFLDGFLETSAAELAALAVAVDGYLLIARGNLMPTYRLPGRTEGDIIGRPFRESVALAMCKEFGDQGDPIDMVVAPGIFSTGHRQVKFGSWLGGWFAPLQVCAGYDKDMSAEPVPTTSPEGGQGEATVAPRTRKRVKAEAEEKEDAAREDHGKGMQAGPAPTTSPGGGQGESTAAPRTRKRVKAEAEDKKSAAREVQDEENTRAKGKAKPKPKPKPKRKPKAAAKERKK